MNTLFSLLSQFIPLIVTFMLAGASYWLAMQSEIDLFGNNSQNTHSIDSSIEGFDLQSKDFDKQTLSLLKGVKAVHYPSSDTWVITTPKLEQFQANGNRLEAKASSADYLAAKDMINLNKNVTIQAIQNGLSTVVETDKLEINNATGDIHAPGSVKGQRPGQSFTAKGLTLNQTTGALETEGTTSLRIETKR